MKTVFNVSRSFNNTKTAQGLFFIKSLLRNTERELIAFESAYDCSFRLLASVF